MDTKRCASAARTISTFIVVVVLSGCAQIGYIARQSQPQIKSTAETVSKTGGYSSAAIADYYKATDPAKRADDRNIIIYARMTAADKNFADFETQLWATSEGFSTGADFAILTLTGLGTVMKFAAQSLSAAAAGVTGAKTSVEKNFLNNKDLAALLQNLEYLRNQIGGHIRACLTKSDAEYPLADAEYDVNKYELAGAKGLVDAINSATNTVTTYTSSNLNCNGAAPPSTTISYTYQIPRPAPAIAVVTTAIVSGINQDNDFKSAGVSAASTVAGVITFTTPTKFVIQAKASGSAAPTESVTMDNGVSPPKLTISGTMTPADKITISGSLPLGQ